MRSRRRHLFHALVITLALTGLAANGDGCSSPTQAKKRTVEEACHEIGWTYCFGHYPSTHETCCPAETPYLNPCAAVQDSVPFNDTTIALSTCAQNTSDAVQAWGQCRSVERCQ